MLQEFEKIETESKEMDQWIRKFSRWSILYRQAFFRDRFRQIDIGAISYSSQKIYILEIFCVHYVRKYFKNFHQVIEIVTIISKFK